MLTAFGMPTSPGERDEFITNLLGADYETIWPGVEVELLHMINVTIEAFAERYVAEAGPKKRARFEVGHWAWHLREGVPVIIIKWGKTFCRIAVPIRQENGNAILNMEVDLPIVHGKPADITATGHYDIIDFDYEPSFLIPLHLEPFKKAKPESKHGMNSEPVHGMNKPY